MKNLFYFLQGLGLACMIFAIGPSIDFFHGLQFAVGLGLIVAVKSKEIEELRKRISALEKN